MTVHRAAAHAKVNLGLAVTGRRPDGNHLLSSVFLRLALHDMLEAEADHAADADSLSIEGELPVSDDNLVLRAAAQLRATVDPGLPPLCFRLRKQVPVAAGLGGGSSDAAAAIDVALAAWGLRLHPAQRLDVALRLGADVPFFATGHHAALVQGIGEQLVPLPAPEPPAGLLLITPRERLSTAAVFAEFDRSPGTGPSTGRGAGTDTMDRVEEIAALLRERVDGMTLAATTAMLREANDLWAPAARRSPGLAAVRETATRVLGRSVLLTGSGPTLFAVYPSEAAAIIAAVTLRTECPHPLKGTTILTTSTTGRGESQ